MCTILHQAQESTLPLTHTHTHCAKFASERTCARGGGEGSTRSWPHAIIANYKCMWPAVSLSRTCMCVRVFVRSTPNIESCVPATLRTREIWSKRQAFLIQSETTTSLALHYQMCVSSVVFAVRSRCVRVFDVRVCLVVYDVCAAHTHMCILLCNNILSCVCVCVHHLNINTMPRNRADVFRVFCFFLLLVATVWCVVFNCILRQRSATLIKWWLQSHKWVCVCVCKGIWTAAVISNNREGRF